MNRYLVTDSYRCLGLGLHVFIDCVNAISSITVVVVVGRLFGLKRWDARRRHQGRISGCLFYSAHEAIWHVNGQLPMGARLIGQKTRFCDWVIAKVVARRCHTHVVEGTARRCRFGRWGWVALQLGRRNSDEFVGVAEGRFLNRNQRILPINHLQSQVFQRFRLLSSSVTTVVSRRDWRVLY